MHIFIKKLLKEQRYQSSTIIHSWSARSFIPGVDTITSIWAFIVWESLIKVHEKQIQVMLFTWKSKIDFKLKLKTRMDILYFSFIDIINYHYFYHTN